MKPFKPKRDTKYATNIEASHRVRERRHETLVNDFAEWLTASGYEVGRNAAIDLGIAEPPIIIEAKTIGKSWSHPIREAVSQLYEYRYFEVIHPDAVLLMLSEREIPDDWLEYLENDRKIGVIWPDGSAYRMSPRAQRALSH